MKEKPEDGKQEEIAPEQDSDSDSDQGANQKP